MSLPVILRPEAGRDADEAWDNLEARRPGLGQVFLSRLSETLSRIGAQPELYGAVWRNVRAARLRQFAYVVYYRVNDSWIEVLAVVHGSRDDSHWQARA